MRTNLNIRKEMTLEDIRNVAPSVFAEHAYEGVSDRYEFIKTSDIVEKMMTEGFIPVMAADCKVKNATKKGFAKHVIKFRHSSLLNTTNTEVPELVLTNSHDRTSAYVLQAGIFRIVCSNGLVVASELYEKLSVKHMGNNADKVLEGSFKIIENIPVVMQQIDQWKGLQVSPELQIEYAKQAVALAPTTLEFSPERVLDFRRQEDKGNDLYTVFNRVQENLLAGGMVGQSKTGKFRAARAITGLNADNKLNQDLWKLTENTAKLIAA